GRSGAAELASWVTAADERPRAYSRARGRALLDGAASVYTPGHEHAGDEQQDHGADKGDDETADAEAGKATGEGVQAGENPREQETAQEGADDPDQNIAHQTQTTAMDDQARQPAR